MPSLVKRILGFEEFKNQEEILDFLKNEEKTNFSNVGIKEIEKNDDFNLWLVTNEKDAFVVIDDGFSPKTLLKRPKKDFNFEVIKEDKKLRLYIQDTITTLPISMPGSQENIKKELTSLING